MAIVCSVLVPISPATPRQGQTAPLSAVDAAAVEAFRERVKDYVKVREKAEGTLPNLSKEATPAEIETHKKALEELVRKARAGAKYGDVFGAGIASHIRATIRDEVTVKDKKTVLEADTKGVPLRVNYPYPETKELSQIPPTLLLRLPELPKQVKYRFVGRNLLLVDSENGLIVDYLSNALP
jgi:hypothetical protein